MPDSLDELHAIRAKMAEEEKGLTSEEKVYRTNRRVAEALAADGYELVPVGDGFYRIASKTSRDAT